MKVINGLSGNKVCILETKQRAKRGGNLTASKGDKQISEPGNITAINQNSDYWRVGQI